MKNYQRGSAMAIVVAIVAVIIVGLGVWQYMSNQKAVPAGAPQANADQAAAAAVPGAQPIAAAPVTLDGGLIVQDAKVGDGAEAQPGMRLSLHYTGTLDDGTVFDSSVARGTPFEFTLGTDPVIEGWQRGIVGMKVGGERKLTIPAALGYGDKANGPIPANSTLHFEVVLLGIVQ